MTFQEFENKLNLLKEQDGFDPKMLIDIMIGDGMARPVGDVEILTYRNMDENIEYICTISSDY